MHKGCGEAGITTLRVRKETYDLETEQRPVWLKRATEGHEGRERWLGKEAGARSGMTLQAAVKGVDFA